MSRPKSAEPRTVRLVVKLTEAEKHEFEVAAAGRPLSTVVRELAHAALAAEGASSVEIRWADPSSSPIGDVLDIADKLRNRSTDGHETVIPDGHDRAVVIAADVPRVGPAADRGVEIEMPVVEVEVPPVQCVVFDDREWSALVRTAGGAAVQVPGLVRRRLFGAAVSRPTDVTPLPKGSR